MFTSWFDAFRTEALVDSVISAFFTLSGTLALTGPDPGAPGSLMNKCKAAKVILAKKLMFSSARSLIIMMQMRTIETINTKTGEGDREGMLRRVGKVGPREERSSGKQSSTERLL